jgi:inosose dehydratase
MAKNQILVGNAPVSWGIFGNNLDDPNIPAYSTVLDELAEAGYQGTELGPYGYYPTEPEQLKSELDCRGLKLASSFVPVELMDESGFKGSVNEVLQVGTLLSHFDVDEIIVSATWSDQRVRSAGFIPSDGSVSWNALQFNVAARRLNELGALIANQLGMTLVIHHHVGTWLETDEETNRILELTNPDLIGLCLDTGHLVYGGGDPVRMIQKWGERVRYIHLKDVWADKLDVIRRDRIDADTAWKIGVFSRIGEGCVDFISLFQTLEDQDYRGWLIVEQDIVTNPDGQLLYTPLECAKYSREYILNRTGW